VGFLFNFALFGSTFMLGLYFQHARGATPFQAGLEHTLFLE
jgi:DHA2 family methylenomycin A resistance protein-like MFS transporter